MNGKIPDAKMGWPAARLGSPLQLLLFPVNVSDSHHGLYFRFYQEFFNTFSKEPNTRVHFLKKQTMLLILAWSVIQHLPHVLFISDLPHGSTWSPSRTPPSALIRSSLQFQKKKKLHRDRDTPSVFIIQGQAQPLSSGQGQAHLTPTPHPPLFPAFLRVHCPKAS